MSAIDFSMKIGKEENPVGDRIVVTRNGNFSPTSPGRLTKPGPLLC